MTIMRMWKDVIHNFHKQKIRMSRQIQTGASKFNKSQVFVGAFQNLLFAGGNNMDNLTCKGSTTNSGAVQLKNLTGTLSLCTSEITKACNTSSWPQPDKTKVAECETLAGRFDKEASACVTETVLESNTSIACACWGGAGFNKTVQAVKKCKFSKEAEKVKKAMKACSEAFRKCRKYEDAAITTVSDCATSASTASTSGIQVFPPPPFQSVSITGSTKVTWPMKTSPVSDMPKHTTVFGVPVFGDNKTTVSP